MSALAETIVQQKSSTVRTLHQPTRTPPQRTQREERSKCQNNGIPPTLHQKATLPKRAKSPPPPLHTPVSRDDLTASQEAGRGQRMPPEPARPVHAAVRAQNSGYKTWNNRGGGRAGVRVGVGKEGKGGGGGREAFVLGPCHVCNGI